MTVQLVGAWLIVALGHVERFKPGDKVVTLFNQRHLGGSIDPLIMQSGLGAAVDGTFRSVGAFDENGLVKMPKSLSYLEAGTLPCAGVTAWNALYGLADKKLIAGQWVLTQGIGGDTPEWGAKAKELTGGLGVDHILEVVGPTSMAQSLASIKLDGVITIIGSVGGIASDQPSFIECVIRCCTTRGIVVGSRVEFEEMCAAIDAIPEKLRPVVDSKFFKFEQLKEAVQRSDKNSLRALADARFVAYVADTGLADDEASTIPVIVLAGFIALFSSSALGLPPPFSPEAGCFNFAATTLLVVGGGSNTGRATIELARLAGIGRVIAVAGLHNEAELKARGASHMIDRHTADALEQVRAITGDDLIYAVDTVNTGQEQELGVAALSNPKRGTLITLRRADGKFDPDRIGTKTAGYERRLVMGISPVHPEVTVGFWREVPAWLKDGKI
ncbi:hypothetical protein V501_01421 [Pseudogymnoascus sp. VKM F-4519 (FW-2642)]|nr:hypothetical protein V501_01421 [Pseudogymnoascus sp. VKM F-4519 (FW-2642)]